MDWAKVLSRLSVPGLTLLVAGALLGAQAARLCRLTMGDGGERWVMPLRIAGVVIAAFGAVILLDLIPGW